MTRRIRVIANALFCFDHGKQIAIDTTIVSALTGAGVRRGLAAGAALKAAKRTKEHKYHELVNSERCRLIVFGFEVAGRWSEDNVISVGTEVVAKVSTLTLYQHWTGLLACTVQRAYAQSLLDLPIAHTRHVSMESRCFAVRP